MALILNIETATKVCSVALGKDGEVVAHKEVHEAGYTHAENLNLFIQDTMKAAGVALSELDAVAVSKGPGSYTGLRIGVSTVKGLCYGLNLPLIAVGTLESMAMGYFHGGGKADIAAPMIDARRMEVFNAMYDRNMVELKPVSADVLEASSYADILEERSVAFFGDGAAKFEPLCAISGASFPQLFPSARHMVSLTERKFQAGTFEDVAYFEPYYLKDFVAGLPKKML